MSRLALIAGFLCGMLVSYQYGCGGGGSSQPAEVVAVAPVGTLAFEELWEPRTLETGVYGIVTPQTLIVTPDGSDPQQSWASNKITGRWGTLAGLDGTSSMPDVTGIGPNASWSVRDGRLWFHAQAADGNEGFPLLTRATFPRGRRIAIEAEIQITSATEGAFVGLALIAGEGDYREIAVRRTNGVNVVVRNTPHTETPIGATGDTVTFRIEYDPIAGFKYLANGVVLNTEAIDHLGAGFASDPGVGLYLVGEGLAGVVEGSVGPVRVWIN